MEKKSSSVKKKLSLDSMPEDAISERYIILLNTIDELNKEREQIRLRLIKMHSSGVDLSQYGINMEERFDYNYEKCAEVFKVKTGKDPPVIHYPEQVIPAHDDIDIDIFKVMLEREQIKEGKLSYTVKRKK
jgi:hypothetical protein